ncbi:hypothetical protein [Dysgonomonas mossii]|uniref:hypothetical protein n=1 Tax=Dysgonomonas mossii TaxID=163665 RepID=UPI0039930C45
MWDIKGHRLDIFPIDGLKKISDLIYFDGPLLSLYCDDNNINYLFYWVDVDSEYNRWIIIETDIFTISDYLNKKISLFNILSTKKSIYITDINNNLDFVHTWLIPTINIPENYFPDQNSMYTFEVKSDDVSLIYFSEYFKKGILQIHLSGNPEIGYGSIDLDLYAKSIGHFSQMSSSLANSFYKVNNRKKQKNKAKYKDQEQPKEKPKTNEKLLFINNLRLEAITPMAASFSILLRTTSNEIGFENMPTIPDKFIEFIFSFINDSEDISTLREYSSILDATAINNYNSFLRVINESDYELKLSYNNNISRERYSRYINPNNARTIISNLEKLDIDEEETVYSTGYFTSINIKTGLYRFDSVDGKVSIGKFNGNILNRIINIVFNKVYNITIERRYLKKASRSKIKYEDVITGFEEDNEIGKPVLPENEPVLF